MLARTPSSLASCNRYAQVPASGPLRAVPIARSCRPAFGNAGKDSYGSCNYSTFAGHEGFLARSRNNNKGLCRSSSYNSQATEVTVERVRNELKALEAERDQAVATAESSARTAMKLTEMVRLLDDLALEKVRGGDEEAAKQVLLEKTSTGEVLDKASAKSQANYALAAKLAQRIGEKQNELLELLRMNPLAAGTSSTNSTNSSSTSSSSTSSNRSSSGSGSGRPYAAPWEKSLEEARERIRTAEKDTASSVRVARKGAEESVAAALTRLRAKDAERESLGQARDRLKRNAEESIAEAQERLRQQDAEVLAYVRRVMGRYRRGEYVSEDELEFAFMQLEKRFMA